MVHNYKTVVRRLGCTIKGLGFRIRLGVMLRFKVTV